jgi:hypothetical protein
MTSLTARITKTIMTSRITRQMNSIMNERSIGVSVKVALLGSLKCNQTSENILFERSAHTPPTLWTLCLARNKLTSGEQQPASCWPKPSENRSCNSAPPTFLWSPTPDRHRQAREKAAKLTTASSSLGFNVVAPVEMSPPIVESDAIDRIELLANYIPTLRPMDSIQGRFHL